MAKRILIIEDEQIITKTLQKLLKTKGYDADVVNSGKEALVRVKENDFNLIICDIMMPEMDGIVTIKAIRKMREAQGKLLIPEVIITGYADENKYKSAVALNVAAYLYKPFETKELLEAIKNNIL